MLFSLQPKKRREDLFDRERELESLEKYIETYPITVVTGLRRVGKSSLIRVFLSESSLPFVHIDGRRMYEMSGGNMGSGVLIRILEEEFSKLSRYKRFASFLRRIRGINIAGSGVEIDPGSFDLTSVIEGMERFAEKEGKYFVLFFDEAQYLRFYGSRGGKDILAFLSLVYDEFEMVKVVITGSEVGMLHDFLRIDDYDSPLHGRPLGTITLQPFSKELAVEFLRKGFEEAGVKMDFDPHDVVEKVGGIPGYLVMFGVKYMETNDVEKALSEVFETMKTLFEKELKELDKRSRRYRVILKLVSSGVRNWAAFKKYFASTGDPISDSRLHSILQTLEKMSILEKTESGYKISDPVLEEILKGS